MYPAHERGLIIWIGPTPSSALEAEFVARRLSLAFPTSSTDLVGSFPMARALVCVATASSCPEVDLFLASCPDAVLNGLRLFVVPGDPAIGRTIQEMIHKNYTIYTHGKKAAGLPFELTQDLASISSPPHSLAESCARWRSGPSVNQTLPIQLSPKTPAPPPMLKLLLQRAFNDCRSIELEQLSGGYSAKVYKVHATFEQRRLVDRPVPYYAKYDRLHKIDKELSNYENLVEAAVPFNLRPNPDYRRSIREGYTHGLIVGNFVEQSEPFWQTARRGHSGSAVFSLFDHAFKSWRLSSYCEAKESLISGLEKQGWKLDEADFQLETVELARKRGLLRPRNELIAKLRSIKPRPYRKGTIHGDLTAENVRTRGSDPVLIDFYSVRPSAPLAYDAATLEVTLAFRKYGKNDGDQDWRKTIESLYAPAQFHRPPEPAQRSHRREWLWNAVRHIRMIALAAEESSREYQTAIAFVLLSRLRHPPSERYTEERFATSLLIADHLIADLEKAQNEKAKPKNPARRNR
jgi:hypothetical protein